MITKNESSQCGFINNSDRRAMIDPEYAIKAVTTIVL